MPMDGDKHGFVVESIRKLLVLNVSDKEILGNLYDVGIQKEDALSLIAEARAPVLEPTSPQIPGQSVQSVSQNAGLVVDGAEGTSTLNVGEQIIKQLGLEEDKSVGQSGSVSIPKQPGPIKTSDVDFGITVKDSKKGLPFGQKNQTFQAQQKPFSQSEPKKTPEEISSSLPQGFSSTGFSQPKEGVSSQTPAPTPWATQQKSSPTSSVSYQQQDQTSSTNISSKVPSFAKQLEMELADAEKDLSEDDLPQDVEDEAFVKKIEDDEDAVSPVLQTKPLPSVSQPTKGKPAPATVSKKQKKTFSENKVAGLGPVSNVELEEIWKKGIIVAVNAKMNEMKRLKDDIEGIIGEQVDLAVSKELERFKVLMDSQKELIISSNKDALEQKQREIDFIIDSKISELKQYNKELTSNLEALRNMRGDQELAMQQVNSSLDEARKLKSQLIIEMNSELIKSKSSAQNFIDQANAHLTEIDGRVNKTLELEKNIADGMLQQAEQKIETLTIQKADELIADLEVEVNRLKTIEKKISPETIEQKIRVLDEFKRQFLSSMQENLAQINIAIQDLNTKNALAEQQLAEKTLAIDAKLEELTRFEKEFSLRIDKLANKK